MRDNVLILHWKRFLTRLTAVVITLLVVHLPVYGDAIDSLYQVFGSADKAKKADMVNSLAGKLYDEGITDTLYRCNSRTGADMVEATMHYLMAEHFYDLGQFDNALQESRLAQSMMNAKKPDKFQSDVLGVLSNAQFRLGEYDEALGTLMEAYKIDKKLNNQELISSDLNSLAAIYLAVEQPVQGLKYIEKSIDIERTIGRPERIATRLGMASELYLMNNEPEKAMSAIKEAYQIDKQAGKPEKAAIRMVQMGTVLESLNRLDEARTTIEQALPELQQTGATYSLAIAYNQLGSIMKKLGDTQKATEYYKLALEQSIKCGSPKTERTAEHGLWETMRDTNPRGALLHLERYTQLNDSMLLEMAATRVKVMNATNRDLEQSELHHQSVVLNNLVKWGGCALVAMLTALLIGLFYSRRKMKKALTIQQQTQVLHDHFFDNITHELQTPLSVVMGAGQQLLTGGKNNADENRRLGEMIVSHGTNMLNLVNQLLDIETARTDIEKPEYKQGDIVMFVKMLVGNFQDKAQQKLVNLEFVAPVNSLTVTFAPDSIRKIAHSLIDNAIKFTPRNGNVTVKLTTPDAGKMRLIVSDTGKGIPPEERDRIFEPMYQSANGDDSVSTALGLSLTNQLVKALNGSIHVESQPGKGTTFTIEFPIQNEDRNNEGDINAEMAVNVDEHIRQSDRGNIKPLVFIVENDDDIAFFIASKLDQFCNLRFARDGREAIKNAQDMVPDLIITDMIMPVMDGKTLIGLVRENTALNHIPIIALTSITTDKERMTCIEAGADAVLVKPFNSDELRLLTQHLIKQRLTLRERYVKTGNSVNNNAQTKKMSKEDKAFINKLIDIIPAHMAKGNIDMDNIAAAMSMSSKQLRERITAIMGMTTVAFVLQVRLNYASQMIVHEGTSLTTIAHRCGFNNLSHFSKMFKQQFGVSPQQYRKNHNDMNLINNPKTSSS